MKKDAGKLFSIAKDNKDTSCVCADGIGMPQMLSNRLVSVNGIPVIPAP